MKSVTFILILYTASSCWPLIDGQQRIAIQRVPFIAHVHCPDGKSRSSAIILDENKVLSVAAPMGTCAGTRVVTVGTANLNTGGGSKYEVQEWHTHSNLYVFRIRGIFPFGDRVQRAVLPAPSQSVAVDTMVFLASYGQAWKYNHVGELHYRQAFVRGRDSTKAVLLLQASYSGSKLKLDKSVLGGPVWVAETGIVYGLLMIPENDGYQPFLDLAEHRLTIDELRSRFKEEL